MSESGPGSEDRILATLTLRVGDRGDSYAAALVVWEGIYGFGLRGEAASVQLYALGETPEDCYRHALVAFHHEYGGSPQMTAFIRALFLSVGAGLGDVDTLLLEAAVSSEN